MLILLLSYLVVLLYFIVPRGGRTEPLLPGWFPYFALSYIFGSIVLVMAYSRKVVRDTPQEVSTAPSTASSWTKGWVIYLIAIWSGFFIYGAYRTFKGDFPIERAIPAGGFLLAFIGLFGWSLYRDNQARKRSKDQE